MSIDSDHAGFLEECEVFGVAFKNGPVPPGYIPPGSIFTPAFTPVGGISGSPVLISGKYSGNVNAVGGIITAAVKFTVAADASNDLMELKIANPIMGNFSNAVQAQHAGFSIIKTANVNLPGGTSNGCFHDLYAEIGGGIILVFEGSTPSTNYTVNATWIYQIQAPAKKEIKK